MIAATCVVCLSWSVAQINWVWCGQPSAVLWKDQLFASKNGRLFGAVGGLFRGTFDPYQKRVDAPARYHTQICSWPTHLAKLEIRDGRLLFFSAGNGGVDGRFYILPMAELPGLEANEFGEAIGRARGYRNSSALLDRYSGSTSGLLFPDHRDPDVLPPLPGLDSPKPAYDEFRERASAYWRVARCDLQLGGAKTVKMFHAHKDKLFVSVELDYLRVWYYDKDNEPIKNPPPIPNRELRTGKLPADFTEHFAVYTASGRDYMVTDKGKLYAAAPKGKTGVEVTALWNDPNRKIAGIVQDQKNDAVYGWGYAGENGSANRFYIKFDPKPVAVQYKLTVPMWGDHSDAYLESYECARAFRKATEKVTLQPSEQHFSGIGGSVPVVA